MARPSCLYCGAALSATAVAAATRARETVLSPGGPARAERALVIVRLEGADPRAIAEGLGAGAYESAQRARRGGYHLHRVSPPEDARAERERLAACGLAVFLVEEGPVRAAAEARVASGGSLDGERLRLRLPGGAAEVDAADLLLVVKGPITREHPARDDRLRFARVGTLEGGYRFHLHLRAGAAPLELDPGGFDFGAPRGGASSQLEIAGWIDRLAAGVPQDDWFRKLPPALSPAVAGAGSALAAADDALRRTVGRGDDVTLDNLAQFRFYSAWRAAVERLVRR